MKLSDVKASIAGGQSTLVDITQFVARSPADSGGGVIAESRPGLQAKVRGA